MDEELYVPISITFPPDSLATLDRLVVEQKLTRSEILRRSFGLYLKEILKTREPDAGIYTDVNGNQVFVGLLGDDGKEKVRNGEWRLLRSF